MLKNMPMGDELKELLKKGGECIFKSCDISLKNTPTLHAVSLPIFMYACSDSAMLLFVPLLLTANGVCLHLLVPPLAQCCHK